MVPRDRARLRADASRLALAPAGHPQGYQDAFNGFVADTYSAIEGNAPEGLPSFADGLRAARITEAVMAAARTAKWVDLEETEV
jgi:predicted dehydrogenase